MNLENLILLCRRDLDDIAQPYLYTDEELTGWLNQAVLEATIRARLLKDDAKTNPDLCKVPVVAGIADITLDPAIFVVRHAFIEGARDPLFRVTARNLDRLERGWDQRDPDECAGDPKYLVMDVSQRLARLYPPPAEAGELHMRVWRKPMDSELLETPQDEPCIAISDHTDLKDWALRCAYLVKDSELYDDKRAAMHEGIFEARFGPRPDEHALQRWLDNPPSEPRGHFF